MPLLSPVDFVRKRTELPAPLAGGRASFWHSGRTAIYQAIKDLHLPAGSGALLPAYACGSEYDAVLKAGLSVSFYRVTASMEPDLDHLASICDSRSAVIYVTHYFGFPQPLNSILAFARSRDLRVIEDCALALYSSEPEGLPLGSRGDASIFSFMKTIAVPDGGAHVLNRPDGPGPANLRASSSRPKARAVLGSFKHQIEQRSLNKTPRLARPGKRLLDAVIQATKPASIPRMPAVRVSDDDPAYRRAVMDLIVLKPHRSNWRISPLAVHLFHRTPHDFIREKRRTNYALLKGHLPEIPGVRAMFPVLPVGCCPLFLPLMVDEPDPFHRYLTSCGIETKRTWSYFHDDMLHSAFPFESWLKTHVISLPIHHQLGEEDMMYIVECLERWRERGAVPPGSRRRP